MLDQWSKVMEGYYLMEKEEKLFDTIEKWIDDKMHSNNKTLEGKPSDELLAC